MCTELLYTRKTDEDLTNLQNIAELYDALEEDGLLIDNLGGTTRISLYLQALNDEKQHYMDHYPPIEEDTLSPEAVDSLEKISIMRMADPDGEGKDGSAFYYAQRFAEDMGRAYICGCTFHQVNR